MAKNNVKTVSDPAPAPDPLEDTAALAPGKSVEPIVLSGKELDPSLLIGKAYAAPVSVEDGPVHLNIADCIFNTLEIVNGKYADITIRGCSGTLLITADERTSFRDITIKDCPNLEVSFCYLSPANRVARDILIIGAVKSVKCLQPSIELRKVG